MKAGWSALQPGRARRSPGAHQGPRREPELICARAPCPVRLPRLCGPAPSRAPHHARTQVPQVARRSPHRRTIRAGNEDHHYSASRMTTSAAQSYGREGCPETR